MYVLVEYIDDLVNKYYEQDNARNETQQAVQVCNYDNNYYGDQVCVPAGGR